MSGLARLVPSLRSLLIFEAVARSGSCSAAAREFNLTQPSASRNIAQLEAHHDERLRDVMSACAREPQTAASLLPVLFKRALDLHQTTFAMGESIAHLHALWFDGRLRRTRGDDGVFRFVPA